MDDERRFLAHDGSRCSCAAPHVVIITPLRDGFWCVSCFQSYNRVRVVKDSELAGGLGRHIEGNDPEWAQTVEIRGEGKPIPLELKQALAKLSEDTLTLAALAWVNGWTEYVGRGPGRPTVGPPHPVLRTRALFEP